MTSKNPALLEPYLGLPVEASLLVLSGILGASTNWLVLRHLSSYLGGSSSRPRHEAELGGAVDGEDGKPSAVLLVSFLRDYGFWRDSAGRLGIDLTALSRKGRFGFVDGLTGLFTPPATTKASPATAGLPNWPHLSWDKQAGVGGVQVAIRAAIDSLGSNSQNIVLIIDQPDLLLAATGATVPQLHDTILELREHVYAAIVTLSADEPLVVPPQQTTLEREHASLVMSLAHEADVLVALRLLDTGAANDVSGVLRITQGGGFDGGDGRPPVEEHEYLYHVGGDGGVRVFERGQ